MYEFLDREGATASLEEVEEHLNICRHCCGLFEFEASFWKVVREKGQECRCPETLRSRIRILIQE